MLTLLAWRNLWRNARRSLIVLSSIIIGVIATIFSNSLSLGMVHQMLENQLGLHTGHLQILHCQYQRNPALEFTIVHPHPLLTKLNQLSNVVVATPRLEHFGLLSSALNSSGITIVGIQPQQEQQLTMIHQTITEGRYLSGRAHEILLSSETARKLEISLGDKIVLMASDRDGVIQSEVATVVGIFRTFNSEFDQMYCFVALPFLQRMLQAEGHVTTIAIRLRTVQQIETVQAQISALLTDPLCVYNYRELLPLLSYMVEMYGELMWVFYLIIGIAMIFGIINTMLMSVMERITEFGVLAAMGMSPKKLVMMIMLEAFYLGIGGAVMGLLAGYGLIRWLQTTGLDLALFSEGLRSIGLPSVIYPLFVPQQILNALIAIPLITLAGALYPAWKVYRLRPIEALRFV